MNTDNHNNQTEQEDKHSGGKHIFMFLGIAVVILVIIKLLIDKFIN